MFEGASLVGRTALRRAATALLGAAASWHLSPNSQTTARPKKKACHAGQRVLPKVAIAAYPGACTGGGPLTGCYVLGTNPNLEKPPAVWPAPLTSCTGQQQGP